MAGVEPYRSTGSGSRSTWVCGVPARFRKLDTHRLGATSHEIAWRGASLHPGGRRFEPVTRPSPDSRADALAFVFSVEAFRSVWQQNGRHAIWRESGADPGARRVQGRTPPLAVAPIPAAPLNGRCRRMGSRRLHGASGGGRVALNSSRRVVERRFRAGGVFCRVPARISFARAHCGFDRRRCGYRRGGHRRRPPRLLRLAARRPAEASASHLGRLGPARMANASPPA